MNEIQKAIAHFEKVIRFHDDDADCTVWRTALAALRKQLAWENQKPLTLEEMMEMDGEPVWVTSPNGVFDSAWMLVSLKSDGAVTDEEFIEFEDYGAAWLAYHTKPEGGGARMDRITGRLPDGTIYVRSETGEEGTGYYTTQRRIPDMMRRLAAYEDTELLPEQVRAYATCKMGPATLTAIKHADVLGKFAEWEAADADGRLLVMPYKVGDTVYAIVPADCKSGECEDCDTRRCKYSAFKTPDEKVQKCREAHSYVCELYVNEVNFCIFDSGVDFTINGYVDAEDCHATREEAEAALKVRTQEHGK